MVVEEIIVISRHEAEDIDFSCSVVSIGSDENFLDENENVVDKLHMNIVDHDKFKGHDLDKYMTIDQAEQIKEFVEDVNTETLVVHCDMGLSRSYGIALALEKVLFNKMNLRENKDPNMTCFKTMLKAYGMELTNEEIEEIKKEYKTINISKKYGELADQMIL